MNRNPNAITILIAEDDDDDRLMIREAFQENKLANDLHFVEDGIQLLEYLRNQGEYLDPVKFPQPDLILLDLNMPRKDGREALEEIKADSKLRFIPVVVLTTSKAEEDILKSYDTGASGFITKPVKFSALVQVVHTLDDYWVQIVRLPPKTLKM